ncbi:MAG: type II toxin-antitoxin system PemK/MazF family toxin, partial [Nanoarchaeota archaeon]|nr:type II toxin-antitoxin system PemK/MazF family toxin [Nanoarchaeota archaeon]MBU1855204.1 type II toxin-antitoxin system PemK/MazF family toxin [Nanoarchaeota archaeon]
LTNRKLRPCLVLSNEMNDNIILCQITSKNIKADDYSIELKKEQTNNGTLRIDSYIQTNMIFTANKFQIVKTICEIDNQIYESVVKNILNTLRKD